MVPEGMIKDIVGAVTWELRSRCGLLREEVESYMDAAIQNSNAAAMQNSNATAIQNSDAAAIQNSDIHAVGVVGCQEDEDQESENGGMFALQRTSLPLGRPTGKKLDEVNVQMLRMHRAAGHSIVLSRWPVCWRRAKLQDGQWNWLGTSVAQDCEESRRITPAPPASTEEPPNLWEYLGMDVFEHEFEEDVFTKKRKVPSDARSCKQNAHGGTFADVTRLLRAGSRRQVILLMDEILHRFPVTAHPFQTLNLSIDAKPLFKRGVSANGRNPASGICVINIDIRGVRGVSQSTCYALLAVTLMHDFVHPPYQGRPDQRVYGCKPCADLADRRFGAVFLIFRTVRFLCQEWHRPPHCAVRGALADGPRRAKDPAVGEP